MNERPVWESAHKAAGDRYWVNSAVASAPLAAMLSEEDRLADRLALAALDAAPQGDLFATLQPVAERDQVRCWLILGEPCSVQRTLTTLLERRHEVVDPATGASQVDERDLLLILDVKRQRLLGLGPAGLAGALPNALVGRGLSYWLGRQRDSNVIAFAGRRAAVNCVTFDFRPGPPSAFTNDLRDRVNFGRLLNELRAGTARAPGRAESLLADRATSLPHSLQGLFCFEAAAAIMRNAAGVDEAELRDARRLFQKAANHLAECGYASALGTSLNGIDLVDQLVFEQRQLHLDLTDGAELPSPGRLPAQLGYEMQTLFAVPLPPVRLASTSVGDGESDTQRRLLFQCGVAAPVLRRLLATTRGGRLVPTVRASSPHDNAKADTIRIAAGERLRMTALVDDELHQRALISSRSGKGRVLIEASSASLRIAPPTRETRVGYPVHFGANCAPPGRHEVRFSFLTPNQSFTRVTRHILVTPEQSHRVEKKIGRAIAPD